MITVSAQTSFKHPVLLLPLDKPCTIKINGNMMDFEAEYLCDSNSKIEVIKGKISLFSANGEERILQTGSKIKITKKDRVENNVPLGKVLKYLNKPSTYLPSLYSGSRDEMIVFPLNSKVIDKNNIRFLFSKEVINTEAVFKMYLKVNDSLVWITNHPLDKKSWSNLPLENGKSYYWKLYCGSHSVKGKIEILSREELNKIDLNSFKSKKDYVQAYFNLLENKCLFDALAVLLKATNEYPKSELFKNLLSTIYKKGLF